MPTAKPSPASAASTAAKHKNRKAPHRPPRTPLEDEIRAAIAAWIAEGQTQHALAQAAGVPRSAIGRFLDGLRTLTLPTLEALAVPLNLRLVRVTTRPPAKRPTPR